MVSPARALSRHFTLAHADRLFPVDLPTRTIARRLYDAVRDLPLVSPLSFVPARLLAQNAPLPGPHHLFVQSDPEIVGTLVRHGVALEEIGIKRREGDRVETDAREIWHRFAENYRLFRGTPVRLRLDYIFSVLFGINEHLTPKNADAVYDRIGHSLTTAAFLPRNLVEQCKIEAIGTFAGPLDDLSHHDALRKSGWRRRVAPIYCPDELTDPDHEHFLANLRRLGEKASCNTRSWPDYLDAHRQMRALFKSLGGTATFHAPRNLRTASLPQADAERLYLKVVTAQAKPSEIDLFRGQMLTEMARMSLDDGLTVQIWPGQLRRGVLNRDTGVPDAGGGSADHLRGLLPLLQKFGREPKLTLVAFLLDESQGSYDLNQAAIEFPALRLAPAARLAASPRGLHRFRELTAEWGGFYNSVGTAIDQDLLSIPARHDMTRRIDCAYLAELVITHQLDEKDAHEVAQELAYGLVKRAYRL